MIGLDLIGVSSGQYAPLVDCVRRGELLAREGVVLGGYSMSAEARQMNALKTVPVCVARALAAGGLKAIDEAVKVGNYAVKVDSRGIQFGTLPGGTTREGVRTRLQDHMKAIEKFTDPAATYPDAAALKNEVLRAFMEWNAVEEGTAAQARNTVSPAVAEAWGQMWLDVSKAAAALPAFLRKIVSNAVEGATGLPVWIWAVLGAGTIGLIGLAAFKILHAAAPAIGKVAAERYLPPGRF